MITQAFEYIQAATLQEALQALVHHGESARALAGGQLLIPALKRRELNVAALIDIGRLPELGMIEQNGNVLQIGAAVTQADVQSSQLVTRNFPMLAQAAQSIGDPMVRNRATVGGAALNIDPAADWLCILKLLDATLHFFGINGTSLVQVNQPQAQAGLVGSLAGQLLTHVSLPLPPEPMQAHYLKIRHASTGYARVGVAAARLSLESDSTGIRVAVTGTLAQTQRLSFLEQSVATLRIDPKANWLTDADALGELPYQKDDADSNGYNRHLTLTMVCKALSQLGLHANS